MGVFQRNSSVCTRNRSTLSGRWDSPGAPGSFPAEGGWATVPLIQASLESDLVVFGLALASASETEQSARIDIAVLGGLRHKESGSLGKPRVRPELPRMTRLADRASASGSPAGQAQKWLKVAVF